MGVMPTPSTGPGSEQGSDPAPWPVTRSGRLSECADIGRLVDCYAMKACASPNLGGIIPTEAETFTAKDTKTARKFGKSWILGARKSHLTIRIGPQAAAHMAERTARLEFERQARDPRNGPTRHWVAEHERHYRSGKVVLVKGHHRGHAPAPDLPTRVMGPRSDAVRFDLANARPRTED